MTLGRNGIELEIPVEDGALPAYLARPAAGHGPGVLVLHEAFGLVEHVRDVCDRLARAGLWSARLSSSSRPTSSAGAAPTTRSRRLSLRRGSRRRG